MHRLDVKQKVCIVTIVLDEVKKCLILKISVVTTCTYLHVQHSETVFFHIVHLYVSCNPLERKLPLYVF